MKEKEGDLEGGFELKQWSLEGRRIKTLRGERGGEEGAERGRGVRERRLGEVETSDRDNC